ncbi:unnamed protein product [Arctogadus glacialis]
MREIPCGQLRAGLSRPDDRGSALWGSACLVIAPAGGQVINKIGSASEASKATLVIAGGIVSASGWCVHLGIGVLVELGAGLYMGWAGAFLAIMGGGMLCCACKRVSPCW